MVIFGMIFVGYIYSNDVKAISVGGILEHSVAIRIDGTLWAWGNNSGFQLGDGTQEERDNPIQIGTNRNWAAVSAGPGYTIAIRTDGTLWTWGNYLNILDRSYYEDRYGIKLANNPIQIGTDRNWASVSAGSAIKAAIKNDGTLWTSNNPRDEQIVLTRIGTDNNWASVSTKHFFAAAIKTDGTLWVWGGRVGGLHKEDIIEHKTPIQVGTNRNWTSVSICNQFAYALRADGMLWKINWYFYSPEEEIEIEQVNFPARR